MRSLVGDAVLDVKYYWTLDADIDGIPVVISRTGWTGEVGYEVYLTDPTRGADLWDTIMEAGRAHDIRPIAPCEARRIEAGIFNYNSRHHPGEQPVRGHGPGAAGRGAGGRLRRQGRAGADPRARVSPASSSASRCRATRSPSRSPRSGRRLHEGQRVGHVTDLIWSPRLERNIGYVWLPIRARAARYAASGRERRRSPGRRDQRRDPVPGSGQGCTGGLARLVRPRLSHASLWV